MSAAKLIVCIAVGFVAAQILWEFLLVAAGWAGKAAVIAFTSLLRFVVMQQRKGSSVVLPEEAKT
jgi:hypothetical protein